MTHLAVIVGSTREARFSEKPAQWIVQHLEKRDGVETRLLDLRDFPMPFFDEPVPPARSGRTPYANDAVKRWTAEIAAADGFVFVMPEYNHGYPAVLKNAIDWVYPEWKRKAAGFVSYGNAGGARGVEQLRQVVTELQMAQSPFAVHVPLSTLMLHFQGGDVDKALAEMDRSANKLIDDLLWWTIALKAARAAV
jgi:NAD(P)H-dependent FMN reductase